MPQRYRFSSKSQRYFCTTSVTICCFWCHKGTDFQANHNNKSAMQSAGMVVFDATKVQIFKQITTLILKEYEYMQLFLMPQRYRFSSKSQRSFSILETEESCFWCHKGTDFQANHNYMTDDLPTDDVVFDATKVQIFKQITTVHYVIDLKRRLFLMPQRYRFSSKSQRKHNGFSLYSSCFWCHKGTDFQANHNQVPKVPLQTWVVFDATKVQIFKQITTSMCLWPPNLLLFLMPQRYRFSSKSQHSLHAPFCSVRCFWCHKGTDFQANHNLERWLASPLPVVFDATKVQIFKQITTYLL